jgi:hypothetical protein
LQFCVQITQKIYQECMSSKEFCEWNVFFSSFFLLIVFTHKCRWLTSSSNLCNEFLQVLTVILKI